MAATLQIALKDLKLRVRDRSALIIGIVAPLSLAFIFNLVFGGATSGAGLSLEYGMVDNDGSDISAAFVSSLEGAEESGVLDLEVFEDRDSAQSSIEADDIDAYFVIPEGFGQSVMGGQSDV
ncbi:MAG TPA: ABC transporter permease, partial [Acidimicrobiia bacterium]|nr:ABC transporter permease [Acidimicrobiia bacterium]